MIVKNLIVVEPSGVTIGDLYRRAHMPLKVPLFLSNDANLTTVGHTFQQGNSHMAIVCKDREDAEKMRNFCDKLHAELSVGKKLTQPTKEEADQLNQVVIIGVLTLEDVIERIL